MKTSLLIASAILSFGQMTFAKGSEGVGGGKGVVCRNSDRTVRSVEVLDLWEARVLRQQNPVASSGDLAADVDRAVVNLSQSFQINYRSRLGEWSCEGQECLLADMRGTAKKFLEESKSVLRLRGVQLELTNDSMELAKPQNCEVEQIVNYQPSGGPILLNQDLFEKMDTTNQAALIAHEAHYKALRYFYGETNSLRVRRAIGYIFAGNQFQLVPDLAEGPGQIHCHSKSNNTPGFGKNTGINDFVLSADFKHLDVRYLSGTTLMGVPNSTELGATFPLLKPVLTNSCDDSDRGTWIWDSLGGPVEYDRAMSISLRCKNGKPQVLITVRNPGESQPKSYPMTCTVTK